MRTEREISAGGVVYRLGENGMEICLIAPAGAETWQLPKGLIEPGEAVEEAARREVREETGIEGEVLEELEAINYWYVRPGSGERARVHKTVHLFLLSFIDGSTDCHDAEVREARWVPADQASKMLTFPNERHAVAKAMEAVARRG